MLFDCQISTTIIILFHKAFEFKHFLEALVLAKAILVFVLTLYGLKDLKNCGIKTKKVLKS